MTENIDRSIINAIIGTTEELVRLAILEYRHDEDMRPTVRELINNLRLKREFGLG